MTHSCCICCCPLFAVSLIRLALTLSCQLSCKLHLLSGLFQLGCAVQLKVAQLILKTGAKLPPLLLYCSSGICQVMLWMVLHVSWLCRHTDAALCTASLTLGTRWQSCMKYSSVEYADILMQHCAQQGVVCAKQPCTYADAIHLVHVWQLQAPHVHVWYAHAPDMSASMRSGVIAFTA